MNIRLFIQLQILTILYFGVFDNPFVFDYKSERKSFSVKPYKVQDTVKCDLYGERNGVLIMEAENTSSNLGNWQFRDSSSIGFQGGYQGAGYLEFRGNTSGTVAPDSPLEYKFKINNGGLYHLAIRAYINLQDDGTGSIADDCYIRMEGDYEEATDYKRNGFSAAPLRILQQDNSLKGISTFWSRTLRIQRNTWFTEPVYNFKAGKEYTLIISGKSANFNIDRIILFRLEDYRFGNAVNQMLPDSSASGCFISPPDSLTATLTEEGSAQLDWRDQVADETGFRVEVSEDGGKTFSVLIDLESNTITYIHDSLKTSQQYCYRVSAFNSKGISVPTNVACIDAPRNSKPITAFNLLTPNEDGQNDRWEVSNLDSVDDYTIKVFTKKGQVVFSSRNYTNNWEGTFNSTPLPSGIYYYIITTNNRGVKNNVTGYITIIR